MTTKEYPDHRKLNYGLQRIIAESVSETLSETDLQLAATLRDALDIAKARSASHGAQALEVDHPPKGGREKTARR